MNAADKLVARRALEQGRLTVEQVEALRAECDRTGRPFEAVAVERGLLAAGELRPAVPRKAPRMPPAYAAMLGASLVIFAGLLVASLLKMRERTRQDEALALETEESRAQADRSGAQAGLTYQRAQVATRLARAQEHLQKARAAMGRVDRLTPSGGSPAEIAAALGEAFVGFNMYLEEMPDDAGVRLERARTHELRRNYDLAIRDLERAGELRPDLKPALLDRIAQLRLLLPRKPQ